MRAMTLEKDDEGQIGGGRGADPVAEPFDLPPKSFLSFLAEQENGVVVQELSIKLRNLIEEIEFTYERFRGKVKGELDVKLKVTLERGQYKVETEYAVKTPKAPPSATIMWLGPNGDLQTSNPKQLTMPLSGVRPVA